jgi:hypothetical protein
MALDNHRWEHIFPYGRWQHFMQVPPTIVTLQRKEERERDKRGENSNSLLRYLKTLLQLHWIHNVE